MSSAPSSGAAAAAQPSRRPSGPTSSAATPPSTRTASAPAAATATAPQTTGRGARTPRRAGAARRSTRSTPETLRRLSAIGLLAGGLTGVASYAAVTAGNASAHQAAWSAHIAETGAQAQVAVAQSRAAAATALLTTSSSTATTNTTTAIEALVTASDRLAAAADASLDADSFAAISTAQQALPPYAAALGSATTAAAANGAGAAGATTAATRLRAADEAVVEATTPLQGLVRQQLTAVDDAQTLASLATALPIVVGGAATALLAGSMVWLARKTHRVINPPLLVGTLLVAGTTLFSAAAAVHSSGVASGASIDAATLQSRAVMLAAAHEARAAELQSVLPGSTAQVQAAGQEAADAVTRVDTSIRDAGGAAWVDYVAAQKQTLAAAPTDRAKAATNATTTSATAFAAFVTAVGPVTAVTAQPDPNTLDAGNTWPWMALLAGLGGGSLAWIGLDRRLKDYR